MTVLDAPVKVRVLICQWDEGPHEWEWVVKQGSSPHFCEKHYEEGRAKARRRGNARRDAERRNGHKPPREEKSAAEVAKEEYQYQALNSLSVVPSSPASPAKGQEWDCLDELEWQDAAHECSHGSLPHDKRISCECWDKVPGVKERRHAH